MPDYPFKAAVRFTRRSLFLVDGHFLICMAFEPIPNEMCDPMSHFPLSAAQHGTIMATVKVGPPSKQQTFVIHKDLLCKASEYFARALNSKFKEGQTQEMMLEDDSVEAFQVFYTWLYSGVFLEETFYGGGNTSRELLWLRTYNLATIRLVSELQEQAYYRLIGNFLAYTATIPSIEFVNDLYQTADDNDQRGQIRHYVASHSAWHIANTKPCKWTDWKVSLDANTAFAAAVALQMTKSHSTDPIYNISHPSDDEAIWKYEAAWTNDDEDNTSENLKRKRDTSDEQDLPNSKRETPSVTDSSTLSPDLASVTAETVPDVKTCKESVMP